MKPELIIDYGCQIGENPLWHPIEQRLYWTDIPTGRLFSYDPATGSHEQHPIGRPVGGFTIQDDGALILFMDLGAIARWQNGHIEYHTNDLSGEENHRFNDVIADPAGRVFCGTIALQAGTQPGRLYRLDIDGSLHLLLDGIGISNGLAFTPDRQHLYYTDSLARRIYIFDYEEKTGALSNQKIWLEIPKNSGVPDGMTVDANSNIWSARWDDSALYCYSPTGIEIQRIKFPARKVSSVTFAGADLNEMYVTTALDGNTKTEEGEGAGALFRLRPGIQGLPEFFSRIKL